MTVPAKTKLEENFKKRATEVFLNADGTPKSTIPLKEFEKLQKEFKTLSRSDKELMFNMPPNLTMGLRMFSINGEKGVEVYGVRDGVVDAWEISVFHRQLSHLLAVLPRQ